MQQAIREIRTVDNGQITLNLPQTFWGQEVEIIILTVNSQKHDKQTLNKKNLQGCLNKYAKPELIETEKNAWFDSIKDKYVSC
ncbi:MAG: hypothetical protein HQK64_10130 [Desulfamplus sp.]|nr:hypothetical protein [Desulfamplus sp.]MBF0390418.1 hypothetical protein [Desulfamplus sp.]